MRITDDVLEQEVIDLGPQRRATRTTDECEEVLFVVSGVGELRHRGERHRLEPETGVNLGPGEEYELESTGAQPMRLVSVRIADPHPEESEGREGALHEGGEHTPLSAGSCIELPARTVHCLETTGRDVMRLVAVFRPAGSPAAAYYPNGTPTYPARPATPQTPG